MKIASRAVGRTGLHATELGFGAGALGNLYKRVEDDDARATLDAAIDAGIGYFDTAPFYGLGLSERRIGDALRGRRSQVLISSKVGRLLRPSDGALPSERYGFVTPMPFEPQFDYTHDGILRSHEASLHRMGLARIDILYVHDIGAMTHGAQHDHFWQQLTHGGGFRALERLRDEGAIAGFGLGVNETSVCMDALRETRLDVILLAGRYTLLEQGALDDLLPACVRNGVSIVIGGPYNSGILATGTRGRGPLYYNYGPASPEIVARVARIEAVAAAHGVPLAAAALRFPLAHRAVVSVIPGLGDARRVAQTLELYRAPIPPTFWADLRREGLIRPDAPLPAGTETAQ